MKPLEGEYAAEDTRELWRLKVLNSQLYLLRVVQRNMKLGALSSIDFRPEEIPGRLTFDFVIARSAQLHLVNRAGETRIFDKV